MSIRQWIGDAKIKSYYMEMIKKSILKVAYLVASLSKKTNAGVLNIQYLALPEASNSNRALDISAQKRRRHVIESSEEED